MKLFEIKKDENSQGEAALKVLGLPVVTVTTIPGYTCEVGIDLGVADVDLGVYRRLCLRDLVGVSPTIGVQLRGPEGFRVFPVPYARVSLDTFAGYISVGVFS